MKNGRLVVAVCGGKTILPCCPERFAHSIGANIAMAECDILTGGGCGYPDAAMKGFLEVRAQEEATVISPWSSQKRHLAAGFPIYDSAVEMNYTGLGYGRNSLIIQRADVVVYFPGGPGTWSELVIALSMERPMIVVGELMNRLEQFLLSNADTITLQKGKLWPIRGGARCSDNCRET